MFSVGDIVYFVETKGRECSIRYGVITLVEAGECFIDFLKLREHRYVKGIPIDEFCDDMKIAWSDAIKQQIANQTKVMGAEIIRGKGRTHYGIATCVCQLADSILNCRPTIASVSSVLMGEHGCKDVAISVPSVVGPSGVQQRIREKWSSEEYREFFDAVEKIRGMVTD